MTTDRPSPRRGIDGSSLARSGVSRRVSVLGVAAVILFAALTRLRATREGRADAGRSVVELNSSGPTFPTLDELVDASDLVVIVRSQLVELSVGAVLAGDASGDSMVLEEEAANGQPVIVDGLRPTRLGDEGVFFLVRGDDRSVPYYARVASRVATWRRTAYTGTPTRRDLRRPIGSAEPFASALHVGMVDREPRRRRRRSAWRPPDARSPQ